MIRKMKHELNCSLLDYMTGEKVVNLHWDQAFNLQAAVQRDLLPWEPPATSKMSKHLLGELTELWERKWGKIDSPDTQEAIKKTVEGLERMSDG